LNKQTGNPEEKILAYAPYFDEKTVKAVTDEISVALKSGLLTDGPNIAEFEKQFAQYIGTKYAVAVNSGSSALELLLRYFKIDAKEVIVPTITFVATPTVVVLAGGKPVFADITENHLCVTLESIKKRVTSKTAGVLVVHLGGLICPEMDEIREYCHEKSLFLIEDTAHAQGATISGKKAGDLCDGAGFSFGPSKIITAGLGGMITTNDAEIDRTACMMRDHGVNSERIMEIVGSNWSMSEVTAIIGKHQLKQTEYFIQKRNEIASYYNNALANIPEAQVFKVPENIRHAYCKYPIILSETVQRDKVAAILRGQFGVEAGNMYYPPCHLHPWFQKNVPTKKTDFPSAEKKLRQVLCLPMHVGLTQKDQTRVIDSLKAAIQQSIT
jgi:perosamine synthetase